MDDTIKLVFSIFGTLGTVLLGLITKGVVDISRTQSKQRTEIELIKADLSEVKSKVSSLHKFRNELEEENSRKILKENEDLRKELLGRRGYDNV